MFENCQDWAISSINTINRNLGVGIMKLEQHPKFETIMVTECGQVWSKNSGRFLKQTKTTQGYLTVTVSEIGKLYRVHRLICETFHLDSPYYGLDVNHKNGIKEDNRKVNVEWCTRSYNIKHAIDNGLNPSRGETHPQALRTEKEVREIFELMQEGWRNKDIADKFNIPKDSVSDLRTKDKWSHIRSDYNFEVKRNDRYSVATVKRVCELLAEGLSPAQVSKQIKSSMKYKDIVRIRNRETWTSISKDYCIPKSTRLVADDAELICSKLQDGESVRQIERDTKYSFDQIYKIYKRKSWVDISCNYNF